MKKEMSRLQSALDKLQSQHDDLENLIRAHRQLLTPFRRLPNEVLSEIFIHCLPEKHNAIMSTQSAPLLLGRVCSRWRMVVYQRTPRLWATLHVPAPSFPLICGWQNIVLPPLELRQLQAEYETKFDRQCNAIREWLQRSNKCLLSISFFPAHQTAQITSVQTRSLFNAAELTEYHIRYLSLLVSFSHRWKSLEIGISNQAQAEFLASIPQRSVTHLQSLYLQPLIPANELEPLFKSGLLAAQNLRTLHLFNLPSSLSTSVINFSGITHLMLRRQPLPGPEPNDERLTINEAYWLFASCRFLVHCAISIIDIKQAIFTPKPLWHAANGKLFLPLLQSLDIMERAYHLGSLFELFDVPSLYSIGYRTMFSAANPEHPERRSPLLMLILQTNGQVMELTLDFQSFDSRRQDIVEIFKRTPQLERLTHKHSNEDMEIIQGISGPQHRLPSFTPLASLKWVLDLLTPSYISQDGYCLCPYLQIIDLSSTMFLSEHDVAHFLQRRLSAAAIGAVARFTSVKIAFFCPKLVDIPALLQTYTEEGQFDLNISYPSKVQYKNGKFERINGLLIPQRLGKGRPRQPWSEDIFSWLRQVSS